MKLVTQTDIPATRLDDEQAVRLICESGFDGVDYSMFKMAHDDCLLNTPAYEAHALRLRDIVQSYGKTFEQSHAPFPSHRDGDEKYNSVIVDRIKRAIEISGILGVKVCVVHPHATQDDQRGFNMRFYNELLPVAKQYGVKIALENMWGVKTLCGVNRIVHNVCSDPADFNSYVDALDRDYFTACLDLGHCGLVGEDTADMIRGMGGERITALHIHDNNLLEDSHTIPFMGKMDWDSIARALGEINYRGNFTFEADRFPGRFPTALVPSALRFMHDIGRYLMGEIEKYRVN